MCVDSLVLRVRAFVVLGVLVGTPLPIHAENTPETEPRELTTIRSELALARDALAWNAAARAWLSRLDASGAGEGAAARWLVDALIARGAQDPALAWRRGLARAESGEVDGAILDFERVASEHDGPLRVRAARALPALYVATGRLAEAARADERLLDEAWADPLPVLARLASTELTQGRVGHARLSLERLATIDPLRAVHDADLAWMRADIARRLDPPRDAAASLLRFASLHAHDARAVPALVAAGERLLAAGDAPAALLAADDAVARAADPATAVEARLLRASIAKRLDRADVARDDVQRALADAPDPSTADRALERVIALDVEESGVLTALARLSQTTRGPDGIARELAGSHFDRLLRFGWERLLADGADPLFLARLAERARRDALPPGLAMRAAERAESLGDASTAAHLYAIAGAGLGPQARDARRAQARVDANTIPRGIAAHDPEHLEALARDGRWDALAEAVDAAPGDALLEPARVLRARAAFKQGETARALAVLEGLPQPGVEAAVLRGDARALAGEWDEACADWQRALAGSSDALALRAWIEVRLAECALRDGRRSHAARGGAHALEMAPRSPAAIAARDLLERTGVSP